MAPDYQDPHSNADTFARNPDNSDDAQSKPLAWRNAWDIPEMTKETEAAVRERDAAERAGMYGDAARAPAGLAVRHHVPAIRRAGAATSRASSRARLRRQQYWQAPRSDPSGCDGRVTSIRASDWRRRSPRSRHARPAERRHPAGTHLRVTFFGLLLVTFLIGRVVPIDPVLAVVGDRASAEVYEQARLALGLDLPLWQQFLIYLGTCCRATSAPAC